MDMNPYWENIHLSAVIFNDEVVQQYQVYSGNIFEDATRIRPDPLDVFVIVIDCDNDPRSKQPEFITPKNRN